jgi:hypothetical protein
MKGFRMRSSEIAPLVRKANGSANDAPEQLAADARNVAAKLNRFQRRLDFQLISIFGG